MQAAWIDGFQRTSVHSKSGRTSYRNENDGAVSGSVDQFDGGTVV